ncbi:MAG: hypothetical protein IJ099_00120 [Alphaproteobacteria bacterium]|nr:hypothetical protein [Alphaproteobacteria bacterium]
MEKAKLTAGQQFLNDLNACQSKEDLLHLAAASIRVSHTKRGVEQRFEEGLSTDSAVINMVAAMAHLNAKIGRDFGGTNSKLAMIMSRYAKFSKGSPKHFKEDFKAAYPEEFAMRNTERKNNFNLVQMRAAAMHNR